MMRKNITCIFALLLLLTFSSCNDFLEQKAQNLVVPTSCSQYKEMLQGNGYFSSFTSYSWWIYLMTDDITYRDYSNIYASSIQSNSIEKYRLAYQWQSEIENESEGFTDGFFSYLYNQALYANIILDKVASLNGTDDEREILKGQALFQRAYAYFCLASTYGDVYSDATLQQPCVAINLSPTATTATFPRNTVSEVWERIKKDVDESVNCLLGHNITNLYEINANAALLLAMRTAINMNNYADAISYGNTLMSRNSKLFDITSKNACATSDSYSGGTDVKNFISPENPEILWLFGSYSYPIDYYFSGLLSTIYFSTSDELIGSYTYDATTQKGDHRLPYFFYPPMDVNLKDMPYAFRNYTTLKYDAEDGYYRCMAFRTAEAYLIMAEAYLGQGDESKALYYLNALRRNRIDHYTDLTASDFTSTDSLRSFIFDERRRELCFEELHRWWDLRRSGKPSIEHVWAKVHYRLNKDDANYVLAYPLSERTYDPTITNPRNDRTAY
jgi:starch-binding outer membrane protein, SusD/RagB family